jgi:hypothetical protein
MSLVTPLVAQFLTRYPATDGYTLICVCEEINRRTQAAVGVDGILTQALLLDNAGEYLARVCERFQNQKGQ